MLTHTNTHGVARWTPCCRYWHFNDRQCQIVKGLRKLVNCVSLWREGEAVHYWICWNVCVRSHFNYVLLWFGVFPCLSLSALLGPDDVPPPRYSPSRPFPWQLSRPLIAVETDREGSNEGGRATQIGSTLAMWSLYHSGFSLNVFYLPFFFFFFLTLSQYSPFHFRVSLFHSLLSLSPIFVFLLLSSFLSPHSLSLSFLCWHPSIICPSFQSSLFLSLLSVPITPDSCLLFSFSLLSLHSLSMTLFLSPAPSLCCCSMSSPVLSCTRQTYCRFVPIVLPAHSLLSWVSVFLDAVINPWLN